MKSRDSKHGDKDDDTVEMSPNEAYAGVSSTATASNDCTTHPNQAYGVVEGRQHTMELTYEVVEGQQPHAMEFHINAAYGAMNRKN